MRRISWPSHPAEAGCCVQALSTRAAQPGKLSQGSLRPTMKVACRFATQLLRHGPMHRRPRKQAAASHAAKEAWLSVRQRSSLNPHGDGDSCSDSEPKWPQQNQQMALSLTPGQNRQQERHDTECTSEAQKSWAAWLISVFTDAADIVTRSTCWLHLPKT